MDAIPIQRPLRINAARAAARAVAKLDAILDDLQPTDAEAHPASPEAKAWAGLVGLVVRVGLRAGEVLDAEAGLKVKEVRSGRGLLWEKREPSNGSLNGSRSRSEGMSIESIELELPPIVAAGTVWIEGELYRVVRRLEGTDFWKLERSE